MGSASSTRKKGKKKGAKQTREQASTSTNVQKPVSVAHQHNDHSGVRHSEQAGCHRPVAGGHTHADLTHMQATNSQEYIEGSEKEFKDSICHDVDMAMKGDSSMLVDSSGSLAGVQRGSSNGPLSIELPAPLTPGAAVQHGTQTTTTTPEVSPNGRRVTSINQGEGIVDERNEQPRGIVELLSGTSAMSDVSLASVSSSPGSSRRGIGSHTTMPDSEPQSPSIPARAMVDQVASPTPMATDLAPTGTLVGEGSGGEGDGDVDMGECTPITLSTETHLNQDDSHTCSHTPDMAGNTGSGSVVVQTGERDQPAAGTCSPLLSQGVTPSSPVHGDDLRSKWRTKWKEESKLSQQEANQRLMERREFEKALVVDLGEGMKGEDMEGDEEGSGESTANDDGDDDGDGDGVVVDESAGDGEDPAELLARLQAIKKKKEQSQKRENTLKLELSRLKAIERIIHKEKAELSKAEREAQQWLQEQRQEQDDSAINEGNERLTRRQSTPASRVGARPTGSRQQRDPSAVLGGTARGSANASTGRGKALTGKKRKKKPLTGNQLPIAQRVYGT